MKCEKHGMMPSRLVKTRKLRKWASPYMLQGGSDPSNTDPLAMEPAEGEDWVSTPPHIMVLLPSGMDLSMISTDHMAGVPYVMWAGTPYQHIMVPISEGEMEH